MNSLWRVSPWSAPSHNCQLSFLEGWWNEGKMEIYFLICGLLPVWNTIRWIICLISMRLYLVCQMFTQLRFTYEQESHPEEFFIPYVWQLVLSHWYDSWSFSIHIVSRLHIIILLLHFELCWSCFISFCL